MSHLSSPNFAGRAPGRSQSVGDLWSKPPTRRHAYIDDRLRRPRWAAATLPPKVIRACFARWVLTLPSLRKLVEHDAEPETPRPSGVQIRRPVRCGIRRSPSPSLKKGITRWTVGQCASETRQTGVGQAAEYPHTGCRRTSSELSQLRVRRNGRRLMDPSENRSTISGRRRAQREQTERMTAATSFDENDPGTPRRIGAGSPVHIGNWSATTLGPTSLDLRDSKSAKSDDRGDGRLLR
jgi:hypothetical protein